MIGVVSPRFDPPDCTVGTELELLEIAGVKIFVQFLPQTGRRHCRELGVSLKLDPFKPISSPKNKTH